MYNVDKVNDHLEHALAYARIANDPNVLVSALNAQAVCAFAFQRYEDALKNYQEALSFIQRVTPLLQARTYLGVAVSAAYCDDKIMALQHLKLGLDTFPPVPENDPHFHIANSDLGTRCLLEGLTYVALKQPYEAERAFSSIGKLSPSTRIAQSTRIELLIHRALNAVDLNNRELSYRCLRQAGMGIKQLESKLLSSKAQRAYIQIRAIWPSDPLILPLSTFFL